MEVRQSQIFWVTSLSFYFSECGDVPPVAALVAVAASTANPQNLYLACAMPVFTWTRSLCEDHAKNTCTRTVSGKISFPQSGRKHFKTSFP